MRLDLDIINEKGLHARASAKFVETVEAYDAQAVVAKDGMEVGGDSIMGLMMLAASKGSQIAIETSGNQSQELAEALRDLVSDFFGEGK